MGARIWIPLPDNDFDPTECAVPWRELVRGGHDVVFATEKGKTPEADPRLLTSVVFGKLGASPEAKEVYAEMAKTPAFQKPVSWEAIEPARFDGLLLPGGHAPGMRQYLGSTTLREKLLSFWKLDRPVGAICHGVLALARTQDPVTGKSVLANSRTTCLLKYMEMVAYLSTFWKLGRYYRTYDLTVEDEVRAALDSPNTQFESGPFTLADPSKGLEQGADFVVRDGRYVSARWPGDASLFGRQFRSLVEGRTETRQQTEAEVRA
jgi:putative intracellular protease/amidase